MAAQGLFVERDELEGDAHYLDKKAPCRSANLGVLRALSAFRYS
jgi:hypothetical protein